MPLEVKWSSRNYFLSFVLKRIVEEDITPRTDLLRSFVMVRKDVSVNVLKRRRLKHKVYIKK